ncbi:MAG: hypothetical protein IKM59_04385, partial [Oscillospiraceae bacterium]|nr:hypothetical protein [Oscillospiraceae bacterium]
LPRGRIPVSMRPNGNPEEVYYYFKVRQWVDLPHEIEFRDSVKGRPLFSTRFLLEQCRQSYELFAVFSPTDYCLMKALHKAMDCLRAEDTPICVPVDRNNILSCANGAFVITNQKANTVYSVSIADFESSPRAAFSYLKRHL